MTMADTATEPKQQVEEKDTSAKDVDVTFSMESSHEDGAFEATLRLDIRDDFFDEELKGEHSSVGVGSEFKENPSTNGSLFSDDERLEESDERLEGSDISKDKDKKQKIKQFKTVLLVLLALVLIIVAGVYLLRAEGPPSFASSNTTDLGTLIDIFNTNTTEGMP
mmetsp:Transcript_8296/g.12037  ORF Transcript_8296/g.12037 Transcript_8296/m.12037 type:complete len:165 (+) Transcript_8296:77-571(+)